MNILSGIAIANYAPKPVSWLKPTCNLREPAFHFGVLTNTCIDL